MEKLIKQLRHGQITIPKEFREALGLRDDDVLSVRLVDGKLEVRPVKVEPRTGGSPWARELYEMFSPVRKSLKGRTEEEINAAIDHGVREVRSRRDESRH